MGDSYRVVVLPMKPVRSTSKRNEETHVIEQQIRDVLFRPTAVLTRPPLPAFFAGPSGVQQARGQERGSSRKRLHQLRPRDVPEPAQVQGPREGPRHHGQARQVRKITHNTTHHTTPHRTTTHYNTNTPVVNVLAIVRSPSCPCSIVRHPCCRCIHKIIFCRPDRGLRRGRPVSSPFVQCLVSFRRTARGGNKLPSLPSLPT